MIVLVLCIIAVHIPLLLRPDTSADVLIDFGYELHRKTLAEVRHHGAVKQGLCLKCRQSQKILHVRIFGDGGHSALVSQIIVLLDEDRPKRNPGRICRTASLQLDRLHVDLFNMLPRHHGCQLHPTVCLQQLPAKRHKEILNGQLVFVR